MGMLPTSAPSILTGNEDGRRVVCHIKRYGARRVLLLITIFFMAPVAWAQRITPYTPDNDSVVLQKVPPTTDPRVRQFDRLRDEYRKKPHDLTKALALAKSYIDYGRSTGDARYLGRAMAIITPYLVGPEPPISMLLLHATIEQSRHAFTEARAELNVIVQRDPANAQAWLTLATVAMVQGDHTLANRACVHLTNNAGDFMGLICSASLRALSGQTRQAYALLGMVEDPGPKAPPDIRAWIEGLMADVAIQMGDTAAAEQHFKDALKWTPGDNFLIADYGHFLLDQHRYRDAIELIGADTQSDTSFLIVVTAENALGLPQATSDITQMDARFQSMAQRGDHVFMREQSSYMLHVKHDPVQALALAKSNWQNQRAPQDVRVYLEAALGAHQPAAAKPALDFIQRTGLKDVRLDPAIAQLLAADNAPTPAAAATTAASIQASP